ncbi:ComEA family DNA-binding protein [Streptomyces sp. NBC_00102]|uniref:ComEA family DNA-binding protein n=1 Tax=Streptomyces sp. NBC_00102 TaxID=2975652 RepID=UPI00224FFDB4|nr:ComEA family DNA-binding protein [Streptomyces sp. NBC_00102]MCX5396970.1 ComEA family DNA-binding protein [Streptomyces sp. NBC_00102]
MAPRSASPRSFSSAPVLDVSDLPGSATSLPAGPSHTVVPSDTGAAVAGVAPGARPGRRARGRPVEEAAVAARRRADALLGDAGEDEAEGDAGPSPGWTGVPRRGASALRERLPLWFQLRCGLEPRTAAALGVVLAGLAVLAGAHFWSAGPEGVRVPEAVRVAAEGAAVPRTEHVGAESPSLPPTSPPRLPPTAAHEAEAAGDRIVVDVNGKVRRPGVQHLRAGARVADALRAAGGVVAGTDLTGLNRARILVDGEQVVVGLPTAPQPPGPAGVPGPGGGGQAPAVPLSLGTATTEQLETLPGVGPVLAQHIVDYRVEHGGYGSVDELREVTGIGDRRFADLRPLVRP